jgi:hypothetical protein
MLRQEIETRPYLTEQRKGKPEEKNLNRGAAETESRGRREMAIRVI